MVMKGKDGDKNYLSFNDYCVTVGKDGWVFLVLLWCFLFVWSFRVGDEEEFKDLF